MMRLMSEPSAAVKPYQVPYTAAPIMAAERTARSIFFTMAGVCSTARRREMRLSSVMLR